MNQNKLKNSITVKYNDEINEAALDSDSSILKTADNLYLVRIQGKTREIYVDGEGKFGDANARSGMDVQIESERERIARLFFSKVSGGAVAAAGSAQNVLVKAPMPGLVKKVIVAVSDVVEKNSVLLVLEAMKMENNIMASTRGIVRKVFAVAGTSVEKNAHLVELERIT